MRFSCAIAFVLVTAAPLSAQERVLDWPSVNVTAYIDADGRLSVIERQVMRFTGDWNGGERVFNLRAGQRLDFSSMARLDTVLGTSVEMTRGDLSEVDAYQFTNSRTLRWRSRLPSDPPFDKSERVYRLVYSYTNVLVPQSDGTYLLDHDFGFPDRDGEIARFEVVLTVDTVWKSAEPLQQRYTGEHLPPGASFTITVPLTYAGTRTPAAVLRGAAQRERFMLLAGFAVIVVLLSFRLMSHERALGKFAPLTPETDITPEWLDRNVFVHLPEVAGAAWDDSTSSPEVAATLARLVQEKKLTSEVKRKERWVGSESVLYLTIKVDRSQFHEHERALINALFRSKETTTNTELVRERYRSSGFDPASLIRARLTRLVELTTPRSTATKPSRRVTVLVLVSALAVIVTSVIRRTTDFEVIAIALGLSIPAYVVGLGFAHVWQRRVDRFVVVGAGVLTSVVALSGILVWALLGEQSRQVSALSLAGVALWIVALLHSVLNIARSRHSAERIWLRKQLTAARQYFRTQLSMREPQLRDAWFPYFIAFGLGSHVDKWFKAFGGAANDMSAVRSSASSVGSTSIGGDTGSGSFTGFGGGGGFAGAGGGASFAAAVGGMAASVPAPSSSDSSGGGGSSGGGSSGGGGGGGW